MHQDWEDLLPLLIDHGLLACDVSDDVKSYTSKNNAWETFQTIHRQIIDMRRTPVRRFGVPTVWYICLGDPEYDSPLHQEKASRENTFAYQEFDPSSPKDKSLARELRMKANEIRLANAKTRLEESKNQKKRKRTETRRRFNKLLIQLSLKKQ
jgi:hypothetical protein